MFSHSPEMISSVGMPRLAYLSNNSFIHSFIHSTNTEGSLYARHRVSAGITPMKETNVLYFSHPTQKRCCHWLGMSP